MMSKTHWKQCFNKEYIGAWYCIDEDKELTIAKMAKDEEVTGEKGRKSKELVAYFEEKDSDGKQLKMIMNATNCKTLEKLTGSGAIQDWPGARILVWADPDVSFGGEKTGGIRIRSYAPKTAELFCEDCGTEIKAANGKSPKWIAKYTKDTYGKQLCPECAKKLKEAGSDEAEV